MEGLLIAQVLSGLGETPLERGGWRFPDQHTFVLPVGDTNLWLMVKPPEPLVELRSGRAPSGGRGSPFQQLLAARATGELLDVQQVKLDRLIRFRFGPGEGFVTVPGVTVVAELTGRNANLVLLDEDGVIIGVKREVGESENRYRQLRPGLRYVAPPDYDRPDPRRLGAAVLADQLVGKTIRDLRRLVDGIGPGLTAALAVRAGLGSRDVIAPGQRASLEAALHELIEDPAGLLRQSGGSGGIAELRAAQERAELLVRLQRVEERQVKLLERRLQDVERLRQAAEQAVQLREQADLLLAYRPQAEPGSEVSLQGFSGEQVTVQLAPGLNALQTAESFYGRAKRLEQRLSSAEARVPEIRRELEQAQAELARLPTLELAQLRKRQQATAGSSGAQHRTRPGIRVKGPHGFEIVIGRNARDNDEVTFGIARSKDIWLHVQGYRGSHVIIRAENREVPFDTVLYAARLAAGHSQAADSDNVAVDYTQRKNVWRPKGAARGAVQFTAQKTVYVTPLRNATREAAAGG